MVGIYQSVTTGNNANLYSTLSTNTQYNTVNFTPSTFIKRIPDPRDLQDRTYRVRYVIDKDKTNPLPRDPISGFVLQPLNSDTTSFNLQRCFYIYDIEVVQAFERGVNDGIYYLTLLCGSIAPSQHLTSTIGSSHKTLMKFILHLTEIIQLPILLLQSSVADNVTIGLVNATDGAVPTLLKIQKIYYKGSNYSY